MPHIDTIRPVLLALLALIAANACGPSDRGSAEEREQALIRVNQITTAAAASFNSMLAAERLFGGEGREPQRSDLDVFWMAMQSTTRDLERLDTMLAEDPSLVPETLNYWNGRIQQAISQIQANGMLTDQESPVTARLGEYFGADRVQRETERLFKVVGEVQGRLGITAAGGTAAPPPDAP